MSQQEQLSADHNPKHQLETSLLGKPKHGRQRVSDLAAKQDDLTAADPASEQPDHFAHEEQIT